MSTIPTRYRDIIMPLIDTARGMTEDGQTLSPFAFIGNLTRRQTVPVLLDTASDAAKDQAAATIRRVAALVEADFVFVIMEAWSLPPERLGQFEAIMERYGSIGASPYRLDVVSFTLETRHGLWLAQVPIRPKGNSKRRRTFAAPEFQHFTGAEGRFADLLPHRPDADPPGTLH